MWLEHALDKRRVTGSSPVRPTSLRLSTAKARLSRESKTKAGFIFCDNSELRLGRPSSCFPGFLINFRRTPSLREHPANRKSNQGAANIDHHISWRRRSRRHKRLMEFIAGGEDCAGERSDEKRDRHPDLPAGAAAQRSPEQHCQDRIFG